MSVIEYPPKSFYKLTRQQLITLALALEEQRDRALSAMDRVEGVAKYLDGLAPGDQHYARLIRKAITGEGWE